MNGIQIKIKNEFRIMAKIFAVGLQVLELDYPFEPETNIADDENGIGRGG